LGAHEIFSFDMRTPVLPSIFGSTNIEFIRKLEPFILY